MEAVARPLHFNAGGVPLDVSAGGSRQPGEEKVRSYHHINGPRLLFAVGTAIADRPCKDPSEHDSGTGLLPRVPDGKPHALPRTQDPWLAKRLVSQLRLPLPHQPPSLARSA
jgi:hypothetical protein